MTLNEFINKRCAELGITKTQLCERGNLMWSTLTMIAKGKNIKTVTKQKLAIGLQCTIGDINKCLAENDDPRRKPTKEPSVMETVDKLEKMVAPDPEEEIHLYNMKHPAEPELPEKVPVLKPITDGPSYTDELREHVVNIINSFDPDRPVREMWEEIGRFAARELL